MHTSMNHNRVKGQNGTRGKAFALLSGIIIGTVVTSLIFANYYAGIIIQQSSLREHQLNHFDHPQVHHQKGQRKQLLRNEQSSSPTIDHKDALQSTNNQVGHQSKITQSPKVLPSSVEIHTNENSTSQCDYTKKPSFFDLARETGTDKVKGIAYLPSCLADDSTCTRPSCQREKCRPWGHFYQTMYQQHLTKFLDPDDSFQLMEIGYNLGFGYDTYKKFFAGVPKAELHSIEISCIEEGPREEGKWPWGNFAKSNKEYESLLDRKLLHCGDAADVQWLHQIWNEHLYRKHVLPDGSTSVDSPPLKIVIDDGSHLASHMVHSFFFWFPRIEPGGILIIEDIQPIQEANLFRTQFLPQLMADLHFCGDPNEGKDEACFPQLYPLLQSIHCEMHICVFERNDMPAIPNLSIEDSTPPPNVLDMSQCFTFANVFGDGMQY